MTIDTKALRERLPSFDFEVAEMCGYTCGSEMVSAADGEYVLAADAYEQLGAAADRLAALEAMSGTMNSTLDAVAEMVGVTEADPGQLIMAIESVLAERLRLEAETKRLRSRQAPLNGTINKLRRENERLREALSDYYHQHHCGCGHPACRQCGRDKLAEESLAAGGDK